MLVSSEISQFRLKLPNTIVTVVIVVEEQTDNASVTSIHGKLVF